MTATKWILCVALFAAAATSVAREQGSRRVDDARYSRLLQEPGKQHDTEVLRQLAGRMRDDPEGINRGGRERGGRLPPSAYVYFGQFIDHDLTRDESTIDEAAKPPADRVNRRTPVLDLDNLYGAGPTGSPKLYAADRIHFRLGPTQENPPTLNDLPTSNGVPVLGDDRDDENLILAQLHVAFLQLHNRILDCFIHNEIPEPARYGRTPLERTRCFVTWHYQHAVLNSFLPTIVTADAWKAKDDSAWRLFKPAVGTALALPVEFAQAGFRFGHSLVQDEYSPQARGRFPLADFLLKTRPGRPRPKLPAHLVIDWTLFVTGGANNFAENFDTLIAPALYELPKPAVAVFWAKRSPTEEKLALPEITLRRGSAIGLPSGQQMCAAYNVAPISDRELGFNEETRRFLETHDMLAPNTPLWFYILREAEVRGIKTDKEPPGGECLGEMGSRLVMDVLLGVLQADANSYLRSDPQWAPPRFRCAEGEEEHSLDTLEKLILFAKGRLGR